MTHPLAYFDCHYGVAGDMIIGTLIDAGLSIDDLREGLRAVDVAGYAISASKVRRGGIAGTKFHVAIETDQPPFRHASDFFDVLDKSGLPPQVRETCLSVVRLLQQAEAAVHGVSPEKVHFHEVGVIDTVVDVVGAVLGLHLLGVETVMASPVSVGHGFLDCAHGILPVPPPASVEILKGIPTREVGIEGEIATPTGTALLAVLCKRFGPRPPMVYDEVGYGAGDREFEGKPNLLRLFLGRESAPGSPGDAVTLETNIDDQSPELLGGLIPRLLEAGALDAWITPAVMKKGRPGHVVSVLCDAGAADALETFLFRQTSTFGIRRARVSRPELERRVVDVDTPFGAVRMKEGWRDDVPVKASPEYEDCLARSKETGAALREVYDAAMAAWARGKREEGGKGRVNMKRGT